MAIDPVTVAKVWMVVRPIKRWKERRKAKREGREAVTEEVPMLNGKLTYLSGAVLALSWLAERFGIPATSAEIEAVIAAVLAVGGTIGVIYGRWRATRKTETP